MSWKTATLGDLFEIARGGSPRPIASYLTDASDGINWVSISDASESAKYIRSTKRKIKPEGVSRSRSVKPGDFLLTNSMSFGRPYIMATSGCIHDGWLSLSPRTALTDPDYLFQILSSPETYRKFERLASGATVKNLNIDLVRGVEIPLPPLDEQRRIAAILDQADALRRKRREMIATFSRLSQAFFLEAFGNPLNEENLHPRKTLNALGKVSTGATPPSDKMGMFDGDIPFVTPGDLDHDRPARRTVTEEGAAAGRTVREGAAFVCCIGATIGKMGRARSRSAFNQQINAVEWGLDINDVYGLAALQFYRKKIAAWGASTTLPILKKSSFEKIEIPVPPRADQDAFAECASTIEKQVERAECHLAQLDALFASLQHCAFRGEL